MQEKIEFVSRITREYLDLERIYEIPKQDGLFKNRQKSDFLVE